MNTIKFITQDREAGNVIDEFATRKEAEAAIRAYEEEDRANGCFEENFYEIKADTITYNQFIAVNRDQTGTEYEYSRSDTDGEIYPDWSTAHDAASRAPWAQKPGFDYEAITVEEADRVWPAIDGREGDSGFAAAIRLSREYGDNIPTDEEFAGMDDPNEWPRTYAWEIIGCMAKAHANAWRASNN